MNKLSPQEAKTFETYQKIAARWVQEHSDTDAWAPEFKKFRKLLPHGKVIDIGCGSGRDTSLFIQAGYNYVGIDISRNLLKIARKHNPKGAFYEMSVYDMNFKDVTFDGFWAAASLLHIPRATITKALSEIHRIVKPNGIGFVSLKQGVGEKMVKGSIRDDERFFVYYKKGEFEKILEENDFNVIKTSQRMLHPTDKTAWLIFLIKVGRNK